MDKCREAFELWVKQNTKYYNGMIDTDKHGNYLSLPIHAAWRVWQEQQKRIDELQARVDAATNVYEKYRNGCCDIYDVFDEVEQALKGGES